MQGAFADTVRMLFAKRFGTAEPAIEVFGKPTRSTFDYARRLLEERAAQIGGAKTPASKIDAVYMVGGEECLFLPVRRSTHTRMVLE